VGPKAAGNSGARERLLAGSVIRAALVTGVRSDLPGPVVAIVTQDVFDSVSGLSKLIPQGARLIGTYDSHVGFGQDRVQLAWSRLILPDGRSVALDQEKASDPQGYAGVEDRVDRHWRRLAGAALVSTMLGAGSEMGASASEGPVLQAFRMGAAQSANEAGQQVVGKSLDTQPTLIIRPGFEFRILVANDLTLEPWTQ
jgi:type IV secretion system protein VirB10